MDPHADRFSLQGLLPPLIAFAGATALVVVGALVAGFDPLDPLTYARWDSFHYLSIANDGYHRSAFPCHDSALVCAHAGWYPGYPALFAIPVAIGVDLTVAGLATSWLFCLAGLVILWWRYLEPAPLEARYACLAFAAVTPGMIYLHTVFPLAMLTTCALVALVALAEDRGLVAGLSGAVAAASYPLGALLAPVAVGLALFRRASARQALLAAALTVCGLLAVILFQWLQLGEPLAYFKAQHFPLRNPVVGVIQLVQRGLRNDREAVSALVLLSTATIAAAAYVLVWRRDRVTRLDALAAAFATGVWLVPLSQTGISVYRANAAMLPAAALLRHLSRPLRWAFVVAAVALAVPMSVLFFDGRLV
jgi:hypothetical protein